MDLCKAEMGEGETDEEKAAKAIVEKSGRQISAKNKEKIKAIVKSIADHHATQTAEHEKFTNDAIAALKDLMGSEGNEGEEPKDDKKSSTAPKRKVEVLDIKSTTDSFEEFMVTRRVLRSVDNMVGVALKDLNEHFRAKYPNRK